MVSEDEVLKYAKGLAGVSEEELVEGEKRAKLLKRAGRIFLVVWEGTEPLRIEVRCDGKLGKLLRERYESVMLSRTLGGGGVEVVCSGQLSEEEILDLIRHGWEMIARLSQQKQ